MPKSKSLTLAGAYEEIGKFSSNEFLRNIQNRINAIHVAQTGWLTSGLISDIRKAEEVESKEKASPSSPSKDLTGSITTKFKSKLTQESLLEEARNTHIKTMGFTYITVTSLLSDIEKELEESKNKSNNKDYIDLLTYVEQCLSIVREDVKKRIKLDIFSYDNKIKEINLGRYEQFIFSLQDNYHIQFIESLGGRFLPFAQNFDPLQGKKLERKQIEDFEGACYGYVRTWMQTIHSDEAPRLPRLDNKTLYQQEHQTTSSKAISYDYHISTNFQVIASKIISQLKPDQVYHLRLFHDNRGHATGIRRVMNAEGKMEGIEFFDPNLGIVVFENASACEKWLGAHLCNHCAMSKNLDKVLVGSITFYPVTTQPKDAKPSIPQFAENKSYEYHEIMTLARYPICYSLEEIARRFSQFLPFDTSNNLNIGQELADLHVKFKWGTWRCGSEKKESQRQQLAAFEFLPSLSAQLPPEKFIATRMGANYAMFRDYASSSLLRDYSVNLLSNYPIEEESQLLKKQVQKKISQEINHLATQPDAQLLEKLKSKIDQAPNDLSLAMVVKEWSKENKINENSPKMKNFISDLLNHHEISVYRLDLLRSIILYNLVDIVKDSQDPYLKVIKEAIVAKLNERASFRTILDFVKTETEAKKIQPKSNLALEVNQIIKKIDIDNPIQLKQADHQLEEYAHFKSKPITKYIKNAPKSFEKKGINYSTIIGGFIGGVIALGCFVAFAAASVASMGIVPFIAASIVIPLAGVAGGAGMTSGIRRGINKLGSFFTESSTSHSTEVALATERPKDEFNHSSTVLMKQMKKINPQSNEAPSPQSKTKKDMTSVPANNDPKYAYHPQDRLFGRPQNRSAPQMKEEEKVHDMPSSSLKK